MSTQTKTKPKSQKSNGISPSVVWFEIPADNVERARTFYGKLFDWKIEKYPSTSAKPTTETKTMNTETTTGEYMLLFRGPHWDRELSTDELQQTMDKVMAWFEGLNERGRIKAAQPLGGQGRVITGTDGRFVVDGPFTETKEAVGGYLVLQADSLDEAVEIARSMPTLRYGISVEVRPILAECPIFQRHPDLVRRGTA